MTFFTIVWRNILRRRTRSALTVVGIALGIGTVIALTSIAAGFETGWIHLYTARGADMIVTKASQRSIPAPFAAERSRELSTLPGVAESTGALSDLLSIGQAPAMLVFGWELKAFASAHLHLTDGQWPTTDDETAIVLGTLAADVLKKTTGSTVQVGAGTFTVSGIFESAAVAESGAVLMTLKQLQRVTEEVGQINFVNIRLVPGTTEAQVEALKTTIHERLPGFKVSTAAEIGQNSLAVQVARAMSWATSVIALTVGAVGVMNTVLMSVFERMQEIGILLAIGWRRGRVVRMILYESLILSIVGGLAGIVVGVVAVLFLQNMPLLKGRMEGEFTLMMFPLALGMSVFLGVLGGLYPSYMASRMHPGDALRYE